MKIRVVHFLFIVLATFSLQSCVSNYVVSAPNIYSSEYKTNAKVASLDQRKMESAKRELMSSFSEGQQKIEQLKLANNTIKNAEIAKAIKHTKTIDGLLSEAETYLGTPYRYGGTTRMGIDCSAFVLSVFGAALGMNLPRVAAAQSLEGDKIVREDLQKGDLVFFSQGRRISHVGIVYNVEENGEIKFIHAATSRGVMISSLDDRYWAPKYRFAKRIIDENDQPIAPTLANN